MTIVKQQSVITQYTCDFFQRERVLKRRMKEKKLAKQKMANAEHKVRVATAFRGNRETDLELQVGDEVTVLHKVRLGGGKLFYKIFKEDSLRTGSRFRREMVGLLS